MPLIPALGWTAAIIIPLLWLVFLIRYKAASRGPLFSGRITRSRRVLALLLGLVLAGAAIVAPSTRIELGFVALLLLLYAFGLGDTLRGVQSLPAYQVANRTTLTELRNVALVLLTIALATLAFLALLGWMLTNPVGQILLVVLVVLGIIAVIPLWFAHLFKNFRRL